MTLMRSGFAAAMLLGLAATPSVAASGCFPAPSGRPVRVLFIGNSFTYYNNMPAIAEAVARANGLTLEAGLLASGGATLHDHLIAPETAPAIRKGWDYVVLQEQSGFGDTYLLNGKFRIKPTFRWIDDAVALAAIARTAGARPVLLAHWPAEASPEDAPTIDGLYSAAAQRANACLIRDSAVFAAAEAHQGRRALYADDGLHPTPLKSILIAASVVRELLGRPLRTLPNKVEGEPIEESEGKRLGGKATLTQLAPQTAASAVGWVEQVSEEPLTGKIATPAEPQMPRAGQRISADRLIGTWQGPLGLYPVPVMMDLALVRTGHEIEASLKMTSEGKPVRDADNLPITINDDEVSFVFPKGPNGTAILFRGRLSGAQLAGIAHFRSADGTLEGTGSWSARKIR